MSKAIITGWDKISDNVGNSKYLVYLAISLKKQPGFVKKSMIVVDELPEHAYNATVEIDWKNATVTKVED